MKRWYALAAIGQDRPGIVAELAELIYSHGCNLEDSSMSVLGGEFAALLLFTGGESDLESRLSQACKHLEWERRLTVFFRPLEETPVPYGHGEARVHYEIEATGVDKAGLVARVARSLADRDVTIRKMTTRSEPQPESGTPIYTMRIEANAPSSLPRQEIQTHLERLAEDLNIELTLREAEGLS